MHGCTWLCVKDKCLSELQDHQSHHCSSQLQINHQSQISETHISHVLCNFTVEE